MKGEREPLPVPDWVPIVLRGEAHPVKEEGKNGTISDSELGWCFQRRPLITVDVQTLTHDYGATDAEQMMKAVSSVSPRYTPLLRWSGIGTRWHLFSEFLGGPGGEWAVRSGTHPPPEPPEDPLLFEAFVAFARHLGRVTTYRALALDDRGLAAILEKGQIGPTGECLKGRTPEELNGIVHLHGVAKVLVCRLYIAHLERILGADPSISLHDDWQTTSVIASGYLSESKSVYLFGLSVPVIESCGWTLERVSAEAPEFLGDRYKGHEPWFRFCAPAAPEGVWFDSTLQRTERYGLYTVPHLKARLQNIWRFSSLEELACAVKPFIVQQNELHQLFPKGERKD
uniref:Uncharacterized protein n=1 Tax=Chromera velia CCMP2878 TaxID=1169474 RepID=A0A0G4GW81_9ALVE|mmetsp:Transcript_40921/g.80671  ORF Transcript_40921/g.80671 Transcript_40921/m.80671 type:complete len:342 (+) Transcript_40921:295-1320(+)|eukprot:Cvel_23638.t1-p1 / transcript=Cvel_23638.t1 / gene=Cvel_23638 / organism=Chromera_velia_CCMP2878 / gene_product=hypothetical protein / transcript_product=hypothetical protein / location=Cvel_scaffold2458:14396-16412(+) / protein_length=341 / sequence_SO=supercontig / SO=protein_coding / is_pseudo=false